MHFIGFGAKHNAIACTERGKNNAYNAYKSCCTGSSRVQWKAKLVQGWRPPCTAADAVDFALTVALCCIKPQIALHCIAVNYILWQMIPQSGNVLQHVSGIATYSSAHYTGRTRLDMILVVSIVQWCVVRWHDVTCNTLQFNPCMQGSCAMLVQQEGVALVCNNVWCTRELLHLH